MVDRIESPYIHAASADNFPSLVLENSRRGPVLVNFWSKQVGSCLDLYPLLVQIIHHYDGRVLLINVDAESEIGLAKEHGITRVPVLKLFRNEQIIEAEDGFQSAQDIIKLLDAYVARDSDQTLADAVELYTEGKTVLAYELIAKAIADDPVNHRLPLTMCKLLKHEGRIAEAIKLIDSLPENIRANREIEQFYSLLSTID